MKSEVNAWIFVGLAFTVREKVLSSLERQYLFDSQMMWSLAHAAIPSKEITIITTRSTVLFCALKTFTVGEF
jgi:hypothetical protein